MFVKETAKVCGNIYAPTVSITEGANFSGSIDMDGKKAGQQFGNKRSRPGAWSKQPVAQHNNGVVQKISRWR